MPREQIFGLGLSASEPLAQSRTEIGLPNLSGQPFKIDQITV